MSKPANAPPAFVRRAPWERLRAFTAARIALGRVGVSVPTAAYLDFQLSHARARDAVHLPLDREKLFAGLGELGLPVLELYSRAGDRREYLLRPDLGRRLAPESLAALQNAVASESAEQADLALVIADGLSAPAIERQTIPFLRAFLPLARRRGWRLAGTVFVNLGRVAVGDEVGEILGAKVAAVLIGERPGLSSPDSMGVYLTYAPIKGLTDERRNCISNIRPEGQPFEQAARTLEHLLAKSLAAKISGVDLKDDQALPDPTLPPSRTVTA